MSRGIGDGHREIHLGGALGGEWGSTRMQKGDIYDPGDCLPGPLPAEAPEKFYALVLIKLK